MMLNRRLFLGGSASVAAMLALAACAKSSDGGKGGASGETKTGDAAINAQDRSALQEGGELKFSITAPISNWNQATVDGNGVDLRMIYHFINPYFITWGMDGKATANPDFFTKYEGKEVDGKTVVTVEINEKAVWGNGRKMDAEDIVETFTHGKDEEYKFASTDGLDLIESVKPQGERGAVITFNSTYPDWTGVVTGVSPKELMSTAQAFNEALAGEANYNNDYFAGPFKIKDYDKAQQLLTLEANDKWWGNKPLLETVTFRVLDSSAEATSFANKSIDVVDYIISSDVYNQCIGREDAEVRQNFGLQWRHFTLNAAQGPLADKAVRQALLLGTDRAAIAKSDLAGLPVDVDKLLLGNHFFMPSQDGYVDNGKAWAYDVEKAKKLLDEAGWTAGADGIREKDGQRLSIPFTLPAGTPTTENEATLLQSQMKEIGIEITMNPVESAKFFPDYINDRNFQLTAFTWQGTQYPMQNIGQIYASGSDSNFTSIAVDEIDQLAQKVSTTTDEKERIKLTNEVDVLIWENVMNFPMYEREQLTAVPKNLANFGAIGLSTFKAEDIGYMKESK